MSITHVMGTKTAQLIRHLNKPKPPHGTVASTYCVGGNKHTMLHDGKGGFYEDTVLLNDLDCLRNLKQLE